MQTRIPSQLAPVRRRQQGVLALKGAVYGLAVSSLAGIAVGSWRWWSGQPIPPLTTVLVLASGPILGMIVGLLWRLSLRVAAAAVDRHYQLKDRALTALDFANRDGDLHALQVHDAEEHLQSIEAARVVPLRVPRLLPYAAGLLAIATALLLIPLPQPVTASITKPAEIDNIALRLTEDLKELDKLAQDEENEELRELLEKLREKVDELKEPSVDVREALATLSEMQAEIAKQQAQYNEGLVDAQLQALGSAMSVASALQAAGQNLQAGQFEQAAQKLEELEDLKMERREAKAAAEQLQKVAQSMSEAGLGKLSAATSEMSDGLGSGNSSKATAGARSLSKSVRQHNSRKNMNRLLALQLNRLNECKSQCQNCQSLCPFCKGSQCEGQCQNSSLVEGLNPKKSTSPSQNFGKTTSGNLFAEKTGLLSQRNLQEITGMPGEGPSEIETSSSPEGRQQSQRGYREVYQEYRKLSEEVLESEAIPLGHRQTIRKYFELIRPANEPAGE